MKGDRRMADILTLGELLIDLTQTGTDENGNGIFAAYPGGAPANVAVAAKRLGADTGFVGKVGNDVFGRSLKAVLDKEGVDAKGLCVSDKVPTTLAIVSIDSKGEREFSFYRNPGADTQLTEDEAIAAIRESFPLILHVGSLSLTDEPIRTACESAVRYAKENGALISYDPNYRASLWESEETAVVMMKKLLPLTDILKVSDEELVMLTGSSDPEVGTKVLADYGISLVLVTLGPDGVFIRSGDNFATVPGFKVTVADTNGAGDTFLGATLCKLAGKLRQGGELEWDELKDFVVFANKAASLTCSRHGAIPAMPRAEEINL